MAQNTVTLVGNLTQDPELRFTASGMAQARISIAVNRIWNDRNGQRQEDTSFFSGTVWRELAEHVSESLKKGMRVIVTGSLEQRSWQTENGDKRSVVEIRIDEVGPSLRWATAVVNRTPRNEGASPRNGGDDWGAPAPVPVQANGPASDLGPSEDEAPF